MQIPNSLQPWQLNTTTTRNTNTNTNMNTNTNNETNTNTNTGTNKHTNAYTFYKYIRRSVRSCSQTIPEKVRNSRPINMGFKDWR